MSNSPGDGEILAAKGEGESAFSFPDLFLLTHERQIEEWHKLRRGATRAVRTWIEDQVAPGVGDLATHLDHVTVLDQKWPASVLVVPDTPFVGEEPAIGLGFGWSYDKVGLATSDDGRPFVAMTLPSKSPAGAAARRAALADGGRELRAQHRYKAEKDHPVWRYIDLPEGWWTDLDATRAAILSETATLLELFEGALRRGAAAATAAALA
jgi:hypothetical protein